MLSNSSPELQNYFFSVFLPFYAPYLWIQGTFHNQRQYVCVHWLQHLNSHLCVKYCTFFQQRRRENRGRRISNNPFWVSLQHVTIASNPPSGASSMFQTSSSSYDSGINIFLSSCSHWWWCVSMLFKKSLVSAPHTSKHSPIAKNWIFGRGCKFWTGLSYLVIG